VRNRASCVSFKQVK